MHVLEAALAANLKPYPLRQARSGPAEWPDAAGAMVRPSVGLLAIGVFAFSLVAASMAGPDETAILRGKADAVRSR
jgi:hypothetical protein